MKEKIKASCILFYVQKVIIEVWKDNILENLVERKYDFEMVKKTMQKSIIKSTKLNISIILLTLSSYRVCYINSITLTLQL